MPMTATTPTVLRATSSADFLAALPRLTGLDAPNSCHVVLFGGESAGHANRTLGSARLDLPSRRHLRDMESMMAWAAQVATLAARAHSAVVVLDTTAQLPYVPADSPYGVLASMVKLAGEALEGTDSEHALRLKDLLLVGANGWVSLLSNNDATLRPLDEITSSPLRDPDHKAIPLEEWRAAHPDNTTEDPAEIDSMIQKMAKRS